MMRQVLQKLIQSSKSGHDPSIRVLYSRQIKLWPTLDGTFHLKNGQKKIKLEKFTKNGQKYEN